MFISFMREQHCGSDGVETPVNTEARRPVRHGIVPFVRACMTDAAVAALTTVMTKVRSVSCGGRLHAAQPERQPAENVDDRLDSHGLKTCGEYLQALVDEHNLLRREY